MCVEGQREVFVVIIYYLSALNGDCTFTTMRYVEDIAQVEYLCMVPGSLEIAVCGLKGTFIRVVIY